MLFWLAKHILLIAVATLITKNPVPPNIVMLGNNFMADPFFTLVTTKNMPVNRKNRIKYNK